MSFDRLRYELRLMGKKVILTPLAVMGGLVILGLVLNVLGGDSGRTAQLFMLGLEALLPLAAGVIVAMISVRDSALELQLSFPSRYATTTMWRTLLIVIWTICVALVTNSIILWKFARIPDQLLSWALPSRILVTQLAWLSPLCWFVTAGLCLALLLRNHLGSATILGLIWLMESFFANLFETTTWLQPVFLFPTTFALSSTYWLINRLVLLVIAFLLLIVSWLLLYNTEGLLKGSSEE
jgi:hypothetical protein